MVLAALLTLVVKDFAVEAFQIPSGSMEDTLQPGDRVLDNRLVYHVRGVDRGTSSCSAGPVRGTHLHRPAQVGR